MQHVILDVAGHSQGEGALLVSILWAIWNARNQATFAQKPIIISQVIANALGLVEEFEEAMARSLSPGIMPQTLVHKWKPPEVGGTKINVDAAVINSNGAVGIIARTHHGHIIYSSSLYVGRVASVEEAEMRAILHGVEAARELNCAAVIIESDSQLAVNRINCLDEDFSSLGLLSSDIVRLSSTFPRCDFQFIRRSGNMPAHLLAKLALSAQLSTVWGGSPPPQIVSSAFADYQHE